VLQKVGVIKKEQLEGANPNKLFNDVCGMRKKLKLKDVKNPSIDDVKSWVEAAGA
jgi:lysyl-tRNA synthetase class 2